MAKVTEQDIIDHLREKIRYHKQECERIENLLEVFTTDMNGPFKKNVPKANPATTERKIKSDPASVTMSVKKLTIPESYSKDLKLPAKIAFALNKLGDAFNEDIAILFSRHEKDLDVKKTSQLISGVLSMLKKKGVLNAEKIGKKYKYSLVK
jgi:hypothetical protein